MNRKSRPALIRTRDTARKDMGFGLEKGKDGLTAYSADTSVFLYRTANAVQLIFLELRKLSMKSFAPLLLVCALSACSTHEIKTSSSESVIAYGKDIKLTVNGTNPEIIDK